MSFKLDNNTRSAIQADNPSYLKATPDGFDLGGRLYPALTVKPTGSDVTFQAVGKEAA